MMVHWHAIMKGLAAIVLPMLGYLVLAARADRTWRKSASCFCPTASAPTSAASVRRRAQAHLLAHGTVRLGFGLFKVLVIAGVAGMVIWSRRDEVIRAQRHRRAAARRLSRRHLRSRRCCGSALALVILALLDYGLQRWKHEQDLKMTHQEVREEMKDMQGDPQIVARRRQIQRQMAMSRMSSAVPKADVIVTNPTELAVAIQYDPAEMAAPIVVAKGAGVLAQRIRRLASRTTSRSSSASRSPSCSTKTSTSANRCRPKRTPPWPKCWRTSTSSRARRCRSRRGRRKTDY